MTRVIAGKAKGRVLKVPAAGTRPTSSKMREALFSKLDSWGVLHGAAVLDLFAGSGALGIEALSRGATAAEFVDMSRSAVKVIKHNLATVGFNAAVHTSNASKFRSDSVFSLVFLDPPYEWNDQAWRDLLVHLLPMLSPDVLLVAERSQRSPCPPLPEGMMVEDSRTFGDSTLWFIGFVPSDS